MPNRSADCAGVIDHVIGPLSLLRLCLYDGLQVLDSRADLSDHYPTAFTLNVEPGASSLEEDCHHCSSQRLPALKAPEDAATWESVEQDIVAELDSSTITSSLQGWLEEPNISHGDAQRRVDTAVNDIIAIL